MDKKQVKTALSNIESALKNVEEKNFKLFFFVPDSKGTPVGSLAYIYDLAYTLTELGYNVQMLYAEKDFVGVEKWLGEKYSSLPHFDSQKDNIAISPSDFLFIPELLPSVMEKTMKLPCKRIVILENFYFLTELIPLGASWETFGIRDCITTTNEMNERVNEIFPNVKTYVIKPSIDTIFTPTEGEKLIVNIITKDASEVNNIIKPLKWRYPLFDFVTFRWVNGRSREEEAKYLKEGAISVWIDDKTDFGFTALEAMACGNIIVGKVPENTPEWMLDESGELLDNGVWFYKMRDLPNFLANVISGLIYGKIPQSLYDDMKKTVSRYSKENQLNTLKDSLNEIFETRQKELTVMVDALKNNLQKEEKN